jgi:DNA-binding ferritin-like protein
MTNEEFERAVDFLLKSQANSEARIEQTHERLNQLGDQLGSYADTQAEMMRIMMRTFEGLAETDKSLRASIIEVAAKQAKTEEAMARLADAQTQSERRIDRLARIVEEERGR